MKESHKKILKKILAMTVVLVLIGLFLPSKGDVKGLNKDPNDLRVVIFDVGQGDSIYIESPAGTQVLIDGGPSEAVLSKLSKIMPKDDRSLDMILLTHPHADHVTGLIKVLEKYEVDAVAFSNLAYDSDTYRTFQKMVGEEKARVMNPKVGDRFDIGGSVFLTDYWPQKDISGENMENVNLSSIVLELDYADFEAVFTGDAEKEVQKSVAPFLNDDIELWKVPHQGSRDSFLPEFIEKIKPEVAVITVGENTYGHPHPEVERYYRGHVPNVYRTDQDGDIIVTSDGKSFQVQKKGL